MARVPLEDLSPFSRRGGFERLSLGMATVEIGLDRPFSVLHISDTHLSAADDDEPPEKQILSLKRTRCFGGRQEEALRDSVLWAREHVDLVVHTGDIVDCDGIRRRRKLSVCRRGNSFRVNETVFRKRKHQ